MTNPYIIECVGALRRLHISLANALRDFEREWMEEELKMAHGNQCALAERLGVHRNTVARRMRELDIEKPIVRSTRRR